MANGKKPGTEIDHTQKTNTDTKFYKKQKPSSFKNRIRIQTLKKKSGSGCATHPELLPAADVHVEELETVKGLVVSDFSLAKSLRGYSQPYKHAHCV